jgi:hypothetical protein
MPANPEQAGLLMEASAKDVASCYGQDKKLDSRGLCRRCSHIRCNPGHRAYLGRVPSLLGATLLLSQIGLTKIDNWQTLP